MSARAGASGSPSGAAIRSTIASSTWSTLMPVLAEMRTTSAGIAAEQLRHLERRTVGIGRGKVDLVHDRDDLELVLDREVGVRERLRLDPLRRVDDEHGPFARLQRARDLVGEVDVPGRIDQVQLMALPGDAHRLGLDRDPPLALEIHRIEQLLAHVAVGDGVRELENPIGQGRFPVVDVGDDREVADAALVHGNQARMLAVMRFCLDRALPGSRTAPTVRAIAGSRVRGALALCRAGGRSVAGPALARAARRSRRTWRRSRRAARVDRGGRAVRGSR